MVKAKKFIKKIDAVKNKMSKEEKHNSDGTDRHTRSASEVRQAMYGKEKEKE